MNLDFILYPKLSRRGIFIGAAVAMMSQSSLAQNYVITEDQTLNYVAEDGVTPYLTDSGALPLQISCQVLGATPGMCLIIDANGNLAQTDCLTAQ